MNENTLMLPKTSVLSSGRRLGIAPNRLGELLRFPDSGESAETAEGEHREDTLSLVLAPGNLSLITLLFPDDSLLWTAALAGGENAALMGDDGEALHIRMMAPGDIVRTFAEYFAPVPQAAERIQGHCSLESFLVLMAFADLQRKNHCLQLLSHTVGIPAITAETIQNEWSEAVEQRDLRWLLPYMREILGYEQEIDIPAAIAELNGFGLVKIENGGIIQSEKGEPLLTMLRNRAMICGIESLYYHESALQSQKTVLLSGGVNVCRIELGETAVLETIGDAELRETLETLFAPGEEPGPMAQQITEIPLEETIETAQETEPSWECACGRKNIGRFCTACGKAKAEEIEHAPSSFCIHCGAPLLPEAKFCIRCGAPH